MALPESAPIPLAPSLMAWHKLGGLPPVYPALAKERRTEGSVVLHVRIGRDGKIRTADPVSSPSSLLTESAIAAVRTWTYLPYLQNGDAVDVSTNFTVNFNIAR